MMTEAEALEFIKECASFGRVSFEDHALDQLEERHIEREDVFAALETAIRCRKQPRERFEVTGFDALGDELCVIVTINGVVCVITIF